MSTYVLANGPASDSDQPRLLYVSYDQYSDNWNSIPHAHACAEIFFVTAGMGRFRAQRSEFPVAVHDLVVVNPNVLHTELSQREAPLTYVVLGVQGLEVQADASGCALIHLGQEREDMLSLLRIILQEARQGLEGSEDACHALMQVLLLRLTRLNDFILAGDEAVAPGPRVNRECELVRRYIDAHFKENLSLDQLAELAHINKYYLAHSFRREYGVAPIRYLITRRIQESRFLLRETDHSLSQIAQILGFSSLSYFSQCFHREEGVSPLEYRKTHRSGGKNSGEL